MFFHPGNILIHPVLQEFFAACADVTRHVKQPFVNLDKYFGLAQCRHVQRRENVAQMLLRHGRAGGTG